MIELLRKYPEMMKTALSFGDDVTVQKEFVEDIAVLGMGGSGFSGDLLKVYLGESERRVHVIKDYTLPAYINKKCLVFAVSYSGNTEETVSGYRSAVRRNARVIAISSGGKLEELSKLNKTQHIKIPSGLPPRLSTPYLIIPILNVLSFSGIIDEQEKIMKKCIANLISSASRIESNTKELAKKVKGKTPLIYASTRMFCVAEKWKTDINENAKIHAFYNLFPEFNHNELCAYDSPKQGYHAIILSDPDDYERIKARIKIFKKITSVSTTPVTEIAVTGDNLFTRLMSTIWMGLFFSYFLAVELGVDPTPVVIIEKLKKELER
jgi:glucose/mannose-6-phosphate isomerase